MFKKFLGTTQFGRRKKYWGALPPNAPPVLEQTATGRVVQGSDMRKNEFH